METPDPPSAPDQGITGDSAQGGDAGSEISPRDARKKEKGSRMRASLSELIERERIQILQIHAMLKCLNDVLLYSDDDNAITHADVANVAARLLDESAARLEVFGAQVARLVASLNANAPSP